MNIEKFKDITTEDSLLAIEAEGKTYQGLYVDMNISEERKYVKEKAVSIAGLLKKVERARIDKSKTYVIVCNHQSLVDILVAFNSFLRCRPRTVLKANFYRQWHGNCS